MPIWDITIDRKSGVYKTVCSEGLTPRYEADSNPHYKQGGHGGTAPTYCGRSTGHNILMTAF